MSPYCNEKMPVLFVGHGSPMNILAKNQFTMALNEIGKKFKPQAILCISAHWLTKNSTLQNQKNQPLVYDFYGFPQPLYEVQYPCEGFDEKMQKSVFELGIENLKHTNDFGLDHGSFCPLIHLYPNAKIKAAQLSIPQNLNYEQYYNIAKKLTKLRSEGIMILASGNVVHNLKEIVFSDDAPTKDYAIEFNDLIVNLINSKNPQPFFSLKQDKPALFNKAHPTDEHFIPLLYALGASDFENQNTQISYPCQFFQNGSISMLSVLFQ